MQFRPDVDPADIVIRSNNPMVADQVQKGSSGILIPGPGEARVECPQCGSPALVLFASGDPIYKDTVVVEIRDVRIAPWLAMNPEKRGKEVVIKAAIPGFHCEAGDCGYEGPVGRRN